MKKGFTLIELLVVIAIIAMLSSLSVVALNSARAKSRDARRLSDIKQIRTALEMYYDNNQTYPNQSAIELGGSSAACLSSTNGFNAVCSGTTYMQIVPKDPMSSANVKYVYNQTGGGAGYTIEYKLEGSTASSTANASSMGYGN